MPVRVAASTGLGEKRLKFRVLVDAAQHRVHADALAYLACGDLGAVAGALLDGVEYGRYWTADYWNGG
jgi:hypothetical protein